MLIHDAFTFFQRWALEAVHRRPVALRMLRTIHAQLFGVVQYFTLIFGSANHHTPIHPSDVCITTANAIFQLLKVRYAIQLIFHKFNYELNLWNFTLFGREVVTVCSSSSSVQWRKQNLEITHPDNMVNNQSRKEKEEGIIWNKVRTLLQDCTDVDALTQVGYIPMCFIHWKL